MRGALLGLGLLTGPFCRGRNPEASLSEGALSPRCTFLLTHQRSTRLPPLMPGLGSEGVNKYNLLHFQAPQSPLGVPTCPGEGSSHQLNAHKCTAEPEEARQPENHCQMCSLSRALARWPNFSLAVSRLGARPHSARQHRGSRAPRPLLHMPPSSSLRSLPHFLSSLSLPPPPSQASPWHHGGAETQCDIHPPLPASQSPSFSLTELAAPPPRPPAQAGGSAALGWGRGERGPTPDPYITLLRPQARPFPFLGLSFSTRTTGRSLSRSDVTTA